jgi:hypothetical protein
MLGPPLVLKSDNGSAFASQEVQLLLDRNSVIPLFSPPYWPRYNGGVWLNFWLAVEPKLCLTHLPSDPFAVTPI